MNRWPPILWLGVFIGSLLIVRGSVGGIRPPWLIAGGVMLVSIFVVSAYVALRPGQGPLRPILLWSMAGLAALYVLFAGAAALSGGEYAGAALLAGTIPLTALNLWVAAVRQGTGETEDTPYPRLSLDDETPLGDTPEHSDALDDEAEGRPTARFRRLRRRESVEK
jgi:hypothetical protein